MAGEAVNKGWSGISNTSPMQGPEQITDLANWAAVRIDASVATAADLPMGGNWPGRRFWVQDVASEYVWTGSWGRTAQLYDKRPVALTNAGGTTFSNRTFVLSTIALNGRITLTGRVSRDAGAGTVVGQVVPEHRPPEEWPFFLVAPGGGNVVGPQFFVTVDAASGDINLSHMAGGAKWDSGSWLTFNENWPARP